MGAGARARSARRRRLFRWAAAGYLALALASFLVLRYHDGPRVPAAAGYTPAVFEPYEVAYRELPAAPGAGLAAGEAAEEETKTVLVLTDRPEEAAALLESLPDNHRRTAPDLATLRFGGLAPGLAPREQAGSALSLMAFLETGRCHLVGHGRGGLAAAHLLARVDPGDPAAGVASFTLLDAPGVIELDLMGERSLNRAAAGVALALLRAIDVGLPHFGGLDRHGLSRAISRARTRYAADQRPVRQILGRFDGPVLIAHPEVSAKGGPPLAVAEEHRRIIAQSEFSTLAAPPGDPGFAEAAGGRIGKFIRRVEAGRATRRATAQPGRLEAARQPTGNEKVPPLAGRALLVLLLAIALASWVTEDLACIGAGFLVANGLVGFGPAVLACFVGLFTGDILLYLCGRWFGHALLRRPPFSWWISEAAVERSEAWFKRQGLKLIFTTRFIPGTRLPTYFGAGALKAGFGRFTLYFSIAVAVWTPLLVGAAALLGHGLLPVFRAYQDNALPALIGAAVLLLVLLKVALPCASYRGRRLLLSRWRRLTRWEFWPMWALYAPVVIYVLGRGLRYRCLTLFTAANPAMPAGGFIGERKAEILRGLAGAGDAVARWTLVPAARPDPGMEDEGEEGKEEEGELTGAAGIAAVDAFCRRHGLGFPLVFKPDEGQRGLGVTIVRSREEAARYLGDAAVDTLVQEYVGGVEFGVFYVRLPAEERGHIFSITEKRMPAVTGDGRRTLEQLILDDGRAVCLAPLHLDVHRERLFDVPAAGEVVPLVEVGTHARGALFLDGRAHITPELTAAVDALSRTYDGFFFGRYDIRVPSTEDLRAGRRLKVIELNGVTSEATHIYDPKHGLFHAWATLIDQWRIALQVAAQNRSRGHPPTPARELWIILREARRRQREIR